MTPDQKDTVTRWIDALRSGRYRQHKNQLKTEWEGDKSFCCLGVLCEVKGTPSWGDEYIIKGRNVLFDLPDEFFIEATSLSCDDKMMLSNMNDGLETDQKSFAEIADWISQRAGLGPKPETMK